MQLSDLAYVWWCVDCVLLIFCFSKWNFSSNVYYFLHQPSSTHSFPALRDSLFYPVSNIVSDVNFIQKRSPYLSNERSEMFLNWKERARPKWIATWSSTKYGSSLCCLNFNPLIRIAYCHKIFVCLFIIVRVSMWN